MVVKRQLEPLLWLIFSAGGVFAALLMPSLLLLFGLAYPLGVVAPPSYEHLRAVLSHPLTLVVLFVLCTSSLFHWAHRFRFVLEDLGLHGLRMPLAVLCYGSAIVGTVATAWVLIRI